MKIGSDCIYVGTRWNWAFGQFVKIVGVIRDEKSLTNEQIEAGGLQDSDIIEFSPYVETAGGERVASFVTSDASPADFAEPLELGI